MRGIPTFLAAAAVLLPTAAWAGGSAVIETSGARAAGMQMSGSEIHVQWQDDDTVRVENAGEDSYIIADDGKAYSVTMTDGRPQVMDMGGMLQMMRARSGGAKDPVGEGAFGSIDSVEPTGETETVAGIEGRVYRVTATDGSGGTRTETMVLTDDPRVVGMTRAYLGSIAAMFGSSDGAGSLSQWQDGLPGDDKGLLRSGHDFRVTSISGGEPSPDAFELPAQPMDLNKMMQGIMQQ